LEVDAIAEAFKATNQSFLDGLTVTLIKEIAPQIVIRLLFKQHMVDDDHNAMGNGHSRTFGSAPTGDAAVLGRQIAVLAVSCRMSGLDQEASQPGIALTGLTTEPLASTFIISW
jgi:hypothetical protein